MGTMQTGSEWSDGPLPRKSSQDGLINSDEALAWCTSVHFRGSPSSGAERAVGEVRGKMIQELQCCRMEHVHLVSEFTCRKGVFQDRNKGIIHYAGV